MPKFGRRKRLSDYLYTKPVMVILLAVVVFMAVSVFERYRIEREMLDRRSESEQEYQLLLERKEELQAKVDYLNGERGIEEEIRKHFDVAKEGEKVIILLGEDQENKVASTESVESKKWYQFWR